MVRREIYLKQIMKWMNKPMIKVITGVRRCGKSYLMRMSIDILKGKGVAQESIIFLNLELFENSHLLTAETLYNHIKNIAPKNGRVYIFIDEVQNCIGWERITASLLAEERFDIYLTGSNASMLSGDLATNIAGRYIEIKVHPLSFSEYIDFNEQLAGRDLTIDHLFNEYLRYGGFPGLFTVTDDDEARRQYLSSIRDTVVLRDTIQRHDVRDADLLERVMAYSFDNIGQTFSSSTVVNYLKSMNFFPSPPTVASYLNALTDAMIIEKSSRYDIKGKKIMQRMEKYFVCDLGIRHAEIGYRDNDISQMLENIIFNELLIRGFEVFVGKEGNREVDFIAMKGDDRIYIQVAYLLASNEVIEREFQPLLAIRDAYPKTVLSMDRVPIGPRDGIKHQYILDFLMNNK
ncbi:MAG: ATP-binding protein [Clostridia bacterium]|nr:ATP-binding protein [Clostridia bacterium]MBN2883226.1 ATP-binding protein [Clostridia bacterium]